MGDVRAQGAIYINTLLHVYLAKHSELRQRLLYSRGAVVMRACQLARSEGDGRGARAATKRHSPEEA